MELFPSLIQGETHSEKMRKKDNETVNVKEKEEKGQTRQKGDLRYT